MKRVKKEVITSEQTETRDKKEELVITATSLIIAIGILLAINYIIFATYHVDTNEIVNQATQISFKSAAAFSPEPVERAQYIISIILLPFIIYTVYQLMNKYLRRIFKTIKDYDITYITTVGIVTGSALLLLFIFTKSTGLFTIYYPKLILSDSLLLWVYLLVLFPVTVIAVYLASDPKNSTTFSIIFKCISAVTILQIFLLNLINKGQTFTVYHFNAMFYSVSQVVMGKTLLVDFNNTYGLYPHFIEPVFRIIGLSVLNYSIVMSALTAISFILLFIFFKDIITNKVIAILGFTSVVFINFFINFSNVVTYIDPYTQFWPLRILFPAILILLGTMYIKTNNKIIYYITFIVAATSILWNIDTGIFVFASWILLLLYMELFQTDRKIAIKNAVKHISISAVSFIAVFGIYALYIYARSGIFPNYLQMLEIPQFYLISGFGMLPLSLYHPWTAIFLIYVCGIVYAVKSVIHNRDSERGKIMWLLSILGIGLFTFYLGRSHDQVLLAPSYVAIIIATVFADMSVTEWKKWGLKLKHHAAVSILLIFILSVAIFSMAYHFEQTNAYSRLGAGAFNDTQQSDITTNIDFIKSHTTEGERIYIYANNYDGLYYGETHTVSAIDIPGYTDQFFTRDHDKITEFTRMNNNTKIFIDKSNELIYEGDRVKDFNEIIAKRYYVIDTSVNGQIAMVVPNVSV